MTTTPTEPVIPNVTEVHWSELYPLGLPAGSVRALLTIGIVGTAWGLIVLHPEQDLPGYLRDLLFLVLGHYFALRRGQGEPMEVSPPPLFLPRGSIRLLIVTSFAALVVLVLRNGGMRKVDETPAAYSMLLVFGFLLGVFSRRITLFLRHRGHRPHRIFSDCRAGVTLLATLVLVLLAWNQVYHFLPSPREILLGRARTPLGAYGPQYVFSAIVGFYFGSRS